MVLNEDALTLQNDEALSSVFANCKFLYDEIMDRYMEMECYTPNSNISVPLRIYEKDEIMRNQVLMLIDKYINEGIAKKELDSLDKKSEKYYQLVAALSLLDSYYEMLSQRN